MTVRPHYGRILLTFWKNNLIREMSFRGHFLVQAASELMWIGMLLVFIKVVFRASSDVSGWSEPQYFFLTGTHIIVTAIFESLFFGNCWRISQLVRTGDLDFVLVQPASAQFLLSFSHMDFSSLANLPVGAALCLHGAVAANIAFDPLRVALFFVVILAGVLTLYSLLFMFAVTSVWLIRQTGVDHLWFYAVSLARYPAEIYRGFAGGALWFTLVFVVPVLLISNLPANVMVRTFEPFMVAYFVVISLLLFGLSRIVLNVALRWYRSASS